MGAVSLELPCPRKFNGVVPDPEPDWTLDTLVVELNALELKLNNSSPARNPLTKSKCLGISTGKGKERKHTGFVMRVPEDDVEDVDSKAEGHSVCTLRSGTRFTGVEFEFSDSDDSEGDLNLGTPEADLMDKPGLVEGSLFESMRESQLRIEEEIWNRFSAIEADMRNINRNTASALLRVERQMNARKESDRRNDKQYQRRIAEELDNHLSAIQRDHERLSLIEERKIRADAASEEAKRKERAQYEEKVRQEKAKAEADARLKAAKAAEEAQKATEEAQKAAEEAQKAALEAGKRAAKEAAEKQANESQRKMKEEIARSKELQSVKSIGKSGKEIIVKSSEAALKLEEERLGVYKKIVEMNSLHDLGSNKAFQSYGRQIARRVKQISGTIENIRTKASDLVKIINDPLCPQSLSISMFAKEVVSLCEDQTMRIASTAFACARVIVLVSSQFPVAMDLVLAEFHRACSYTVPKHIYPSESGLQTREVYLERVEGYMTLYAALVQTEINGVRNFHGLNEGWTWVARFLNTIPASSSSAVALLAFLKAGFALFRKYKAQFRKILSIISREFLVELKSLSDPQLNQVIMAIETYLANNQFLQQPEGWQPEAGLLSKIY
ncbi:mRNA export factor GLE1 isoform X2 [Aristolochia californica]|uniref:mRNA export factor GLE1 isoform X2 n=1 Tax=Aristolochia californica TaxID=171875 RepID=UPI0035D7C40C